VTFTTANARNSSASFLLHFHYLHIIFTITILVGPQDCAMWNRTLQGVPELFVLFVFMRVYISFISVTLLVKPSRTRFYIIITSIQPLG